MRVSISIHHSPWSYHLSNAGYLFCSLLLCLHLNYFNLSFHCEDLHREHFHSICLDPVCVRVCERERERKNKFVYTKLTVACIGQEQLCPKIMKKSEVISDRQTDRQT